MAKKGWDWRNELSAFTLDLQSRLRALDTDKARMGFLKQARRLLEKRGT